MYKLSFSQHVLQLAMIMALMVYFSVPAPVSAQPSQALIEDWRNDDYNFTSSMMDTDSKNNIYVLGDTATTNSLVIKKFTDAGTLLWQTTYSTSESFRGSWIAVDGDGNAVVLASIIRASDGEAHGWLTLKYDTNGNLLWVDSLPGPFRGAVRVEVDAGNNIYVAGYMWLTNDTANTTLDSVLIKYSPDGSTLWTAVFDNNSAIDMPNSIAISPDGSRIGVAGTSGYMLMALMYDPDGNLLWSNTNSNVYAANDLAFGPENSSYFAAGSYSPEDTNPYQMALVKFDAAGRQSWIKSYSVGDRAYRIGVDAQGNILATGVDSIGYMDWMTIKTDSSGNLLWSQRYDGGKNNSEVPNMLAIDTSGAVYVTGTGGPNPSTGTLSYLKGVVVKYNPDGTPQWAVWDNYAGGKAFRFAAGNTLATLGWGYLTTAHYTQTGLADLQPNAPANLSGYASQGNSSYEARLNFSDNADNEFWVEAERCTGSGCTNFTKVAQSRGEDATGLSDTTISRGVTYTYRVRALGFMGLSSPSNTVEIVVPPVSPPAAPSDLTAAMSGANVVLNWQDNSTTEIQFHIERCQGAGCTNFAWLDAREANITTSTDYSAAAGQSYSYRVRAWNSDGYSSYSNIATIATSGGSSAPVAPSNLIGKAVSKNQVKLTWQNNSTIQDGVKIERCRGIGCTKFTQITTVAGTATTFTDSGLTANTTYRYQARTYNSAGDSPYSNISGAKTLKR